MDHRSKELREFLWQQMKGGFADEFPDLDTDPMDVFHCVTIMSGSSGEGQFTG
jgi:hypothetical protein